MEQTNINVEVAAEAKPAKQYIGLYDDSRLAEAVNMHRTLDEHSFESESQNIESPNEKGVEFNKNATRNVLLRMEKSVMKRLLEINYVLIGNHIFS